jgi:hypothetical protein
MYKQTKYRNKKVNVGGEVYDSKKEWRRSQELKLLEKAGEIENLQRQVKFVLIPAQREPDTVGKRGGVIKGKLIEREAAYIADFVYQRNGETVVEDTKSKVTEKEPVFVIKRKLMLYVHGIRVHCV